MKLLVYLVLFYTLINTGFAQVTVSVTGETNTTPNLATSYASLSSALTALNAITGMSGPVTFTLASGSETAPVKGFVIGSASLNPLLSSTNTITINTSGAVTINAGVGTSAGPSATPDGMIVINGADYVTIEGITFTDGNTASTTVAMEFGIALFKRSAGDGSNYITIQNCTFNMQRLNNAAGGGPLVEGSVGIGVYNSVFTAATTALTPTNGGTLATNGTNSNNKFYTNIFNGGNYGIALNGFAATAGVGPSPTPTTFLGDLNNDIGGTSAGQGNTILNFGGAPSATNPSAGIRANNQWSINISYNTINNNNGMGVNHVSTLRGIFAQAGTSANATITYNDVTIKGGGTTTIVTAIENGIGSTAASNTVNITNNIITGDYLTATSGAFYGIHNTPSAANVNINNNTIQNLSYSASGLAGSGAVYPIWHTTGAATNVNANNNTINNITRTGSTGGTTIGIFLNAGTNQTATGNTISNMSIDGAGAASILYGIQTVTGTIVVNNNTVYNLQCIKTSGTSALYGIYNIASPTNETINGNTVYSLTHNGTGIVYGIYHFTTSGTRTMSGNTIHTLSTAGLTIAGINNASSSPNVFKNKVYGITSTSTGAPTVSGIIQGALGTAGTANIYNNLIGDLTAPSASGTDVIRGINITTTTASSNINVYYNTVYLGASSTGANFGTTGIFHTASTTSTTAALDLRNNIIVNNSTAAGTGLVVAYRRSGGTAGTLANYASTSNHNDFFAGTPSAANLIYSDGTSSAQTITAYKSGVFTAGTIAPRDANSFSEDPDFQSVTGSSADFLKYSVYSPKQIESGAVNIAAFTDDYAGTIRQGNTGYTGTGSAPDVGAWELEGQPLDLTPPIISYSTLGNGIVAAARNFTNVSITDPSGVDTNPGTRPRVYYKRSTDANVWNDNTSVTNGWKWMEANGTTSPFDFTIDYSKLNGGTGIAIGDTVQYFVVAQDLAGPNVGINSGTFNSPQISVDLDAAAFPIGGTINSYNIVGTISGTVTVGTGGTYTTLTGAGGLFADINSKVVTGNITAQIISDITESGSNALNQWTEEPGSSNFTVSIQPNAAALRTLSGSFAGGLIRLNGADRVTFDGRFSGSGNYLTFANTSTASNSAVFQIISLGAGAGASNNTIRNCNIAAGSNSVTSTFGIYVGSSSISTTGTGADNNNLSLLNNVITKCYYAIYARGVAATGLLTGLNITGNTIGSNTAADYVTFRGVELQNATAPAISQNEIFNLQLSTSVNNAAIDLGPHITNAVVSRNKIYGLRQTSTAGYGTYGINISSATGTSNININNNVIYDLITRNYSTTSTTWNAFGIRITGGTDHKVYYNSVNLFGPVTGGTSAGMSAAFLVTSTLAAGLDVRDNIFANSTEFAVSGSKSYAAYVVTGTTFGTINYNDYYASGTYGILGFYGADRTTLSAWRTASGGDANSLASNPEFLSNTDLRPNLGSPVLAAGTPITGITTDYLGDPRSGTNPSIGAYENGIDAAGPTITYTVLSNTASTSNRAFTGVSITDYSGVNTTTGKPRVYYKRSTDANVWNDNTSVTNGWKWMEANGTTSPFDFTIDYSKLNGGTGIAIGETVQYFVVAEDLQVPAYVSINSGTFAAAPSSVDLTSAAFPIGGTINSYKIVGAPLTGDFIVGTSFFNKVTGSNITFEKRTRMVLEQVPAARKEVVKSSTLSQTERNKTENIEADDQEITISAIDENIIYQTQEVEQEYFVPFLDGKEYDGSLSAEFDKEKFNELTQLDIEGVYATLTAAVADLNERGVSGPVRFLLTESTYSSETLPITIDVTNDSVPTVTNTVTIRPQSSVTTTITGSSTSAILKLNGADYIIIDGSNSGGSDKNMTLVNTNTATSSAVIWIASKSASKGATNNTIKNCIVYGNGPNTTLGAIVISGSTMGGIAETQNLNNTITNNTVYKAQYGIAVVGPSGNETGTVISNNIIGTAVGADKIGLRGIGLFQQQNVSVTNNQVFGILSTAGNNNAGGIFVGGTMSGGSISQNEIYDIKNSNTGGWGASGILLASTSAAININFVNNVIYDVAGYGWAGNWTDNGHGIRINSGGGYNFYYNSVNLGTNQTIAANSAALYITGGTNFNFVNNIFANTQTTGTRYSVYTTTASTVFTSINYNNYYSLGSVGFLESDRANIAAWRTATGKDASSLSGDPEFTSPTNLLPNSANSNSWNVNNKGVQIASVATDFNGNPRPTTQTGGVPDIGAYEFTHSVPAPAATASGAPAPSSTTTYSQSGLQLGSIAWGAGGTVPSNIDFQYFSGLQVSGGGSKPRIYAYWDITPTGGSGYSYNLTLNYDEAALNGISESDLIVAMSENGIDWTPYTVVGTGPGQIQRDISNNTITIYGLSTFSRFTLGDNNDPLPVELTSFSANVKERDVILKWKTATEVNVYEFEVERAAMNTDKSQIDKDEWKKIGFVKGFGNRASPKDYSYVDIKLNSGKYIYRLKMIDNDGTYEYSGELKVEIDKPVVTDLAQNYPNAFNPATKIEYQLANASNVRLEVFSITGERVASLVNEKLEAGYYLYYFDAGRYGLSSGVYIYRMVASDQLTKSNIVKTKKMLFLK